MNIAIANRLVQLRKAHGYSQEELASLIGISRQAVSKWERAEASPDTDNLIALARLYGLSLDDLLQGPQGAETPSAEDGELVDIGWGHLHVRDAHGEEVHITPGRVFVQDTDGQTTDLDWQHRRPQSRWLTFPFPVLVAGVYLTMGFLGNLWHPGWLLFLSIPLYYSMVEILVHKKSWRHFAYPLFAGLIYLALGLFGGWWHPGWLIFLTVPLFYSIEDIITNRRSWQHFAFPVLVSVVYVALGVLWNLWHPGWLIFFTIPLYYGLFPKPAQATAGDEGDWQEDDWHDPDGSEHI